MGNASCETGDPCSNGFCPAVSTPLPGAPQVSQVLFVPGSGQGKVIVLSKQAAQVMAMGFAPNFVSRGTSEFTTSLPDAGMGFVAAAGADRFVYLPQLGDCVPGGSANDACMVSCSTAEPGCAPTKGFPGVHVNGALARDNLLYFTLASEPSPKLRRVDLACLSLDNSNCSAQPAAAFNGPQPFRGLEYDADENALWWNSYDAGCVFRYIIDPMGTPTLVCEATQPALTRAVGLAASAQGIFAGTLNDDGTRGPIQQLRRCKSGVNGEHPLRELPEVSFPADADRAYLYAYATGKQELLVLNAATAALVTSIPTDGAVVSVEASHAQFVYFATNTTLYRWQKPKPPCPVGSGCGNGCLDPNEGCDSGAGQDPTCAECGCAQP